MTFLTAIVVALVGAELVLRAAGFRYELRVHVIESTAPEAEQVRRGFSIDPYLIWVDNGYYDRLDRARTGTIDIAFLGDSCTQFGTYDDILLRLIEDGGGRKVTSVNLGVAGYTSHQGLKQAERDIAALKPKVATFYYGWNDHWLSIGLSDREIERVNTSVLGRIQSLRIGQLITKAYVALTREKELPVVRVSAAEFHDNLVAMVSAARKVGTIPVLITAPSSHEKGREPTYLEGRWIADLSDLVPVHQEYVGIVRRVAEEKDVILCDLADEFGQLDKEYSKGQCFYKDGIHLTDEGNRRAAAFLFDCLQKKGVLKSLSR